MRAHLRTGGILADEGAKDASRVSYAPVVRPVELANHIAPCRAENPRKDSPTWVNIVVRMLPEQVV